MQDNMPRIYGQSEVLNLITQESGVASRNIRVGQLEARTRQVGEVEQGGAGHVHCKKWGKKLQVPNHLDHFLKPALEGFSETI